MEKTRNSEKERSVFNSGVVSGGRISGIREINGGVLEMGVETLPENFAIAHGHMEGLSSLCESFVDMDVHSLLYEAKIHLHVCPPFSPFHSVSWNIKFTVHSDAVLSSSPCSLPLLNYLRALSKTQSKPVLLLLKSFPGFLTKAGKLFPHGAPFLFSALSSVSSLSPNPAFKKLPPGMPHLSFVC